MAHRPYVIYERTQSAPMWMAGFISLLAIVFFSLSTYLLQTGQTSAFAVIFIIVWISIIYLAVLNFTRLRCTVTPAAIVLTWRLGWPTKMIDRGSVVAATRHRNAWWHGWGIRKVGRGWMWNVWGLDSVQLELDTGRVFRIGTDDPAGLLAALNR